VLISVPCNNCGSTDAITMFAAGVAQRYQIVRCTRCRLMYVSPRQQEPEHVLISQHVIEQSTERDKQEKMRRIEKERLQVRDYRTTRRTLNALYPRRGTLLEIGSGFGFLLAAFKADGWTVTGVDPNREACDVANSVNGVEANSGTLEDMGFPDRSFDVVIMNHVIEHLPDPRATLNEIHRVLKDGGHLMIETPRYDTLMFRILGRRERSLSCEGHVYFFTNSSLRTCYEAAGFRLVEHRCVGRSLTLNRLAYNLGVMSKSPRFQHMADAVTRWLRLNRMSVYLNMRDMQRVCVQKVPEVIPRSSAKAASLPGKAPQVRVDADGDEIMTVAP
jgi:ubiquinone/menaquinone biosynthesis C-methylase UbiE